MNEQQINQVIELLKKLIDHGTQSMKQGSQAQGSQAQPQQGSQAQGSQAQELPPEILEQLLGGSQAQGGQAQQAGQAGQQGQMPPEMLMAMMAGRGKK